MLKILRSLPTPLRWVVYILLTLTILLVGFYQLAAWSGAQEWKATVKKFESAGHSLDYRSYLPTTIPDSENFCAIPELRNLTDPGPLGEAARESLLGGYEYYRLQVNSGLGGRNSAGPPINLETWARACSQFDASASDQPQFEDVVDPASRTPAENESDALTILALLDTLFAPLFSSLDHASARPGARWLPPISDFYDPENPFAMKFPTGTVGVPLSKLLCLRAQAAVYGNQPEKIAPSIHSILHLADAEGTSPLCLIQHLVASVHWRNATTALAEALANHALDDQTLTALQDAFSRVDAIAGSAQGLRMEAISSTRHIELLKSDKSTETWDYSEINPHLYPSGWIDLNRAAILTDLSKTATAIENHDITALKNLEAQRDAWFEEISQSTLEKYRWFLVRLILPVFNSFVSQSFRSQAQLHQAQIACALERYRLRFKSYPASLTDLVPDFLAEIPPDPIDAKPMRYLPPTSEFQYRLYSIGWDQFDNNATPADPIRSDSPGDWVWSYQDLSNPTPQ